MHSTRIEARQPATVSGTALRCPACGGAAMAIEHGTRQRCTDCGTIWMPQRLGYTYNDQYPADRGHHDAMIAHCKQVTLRSWLQRMHFALPGQRVLEVGFGGGATLTWAQAQGAIMAGQEPVAANRAAAIAAGITADRIRENLADFAGETFDLLLYLDAFEHVPDPVAHVSCASTLAHPGTRALLVLPVADSVSRRVMGRLWPHDVDDHWIFYSTRGLVRLWEAAGWRLVDRFYPWKYVSLETIARHARLKTGLDLPLISSATGGVWLNFGERGLVLEKSAQARAA